MWPGPACMVKNGRCAKIPTNSYSIVLALFWNAGIVDLRRFRISPKNWTLIDSLVKKNPYSLQSKNRALE